MKLIALTAIAMIAFAANSVLARLALADGGADALSFTGLRLLAGAAMLWVLLMSRQTRLHTGVAGSWTASAALTGYALSFSVAYLMLGAGTGALILFASVQFGILGWAILKGDRPSRLEWLGVVIAFAALAYLVSPGLVAPDPLGTALMVVAGLCWAAYTLLGRGSTAPLADTAGNFVRAAPLGIVLLAIGMLGRSLEPVAVLYALASGAIASGLGYALWYAVLPQMSRTTAGIVQLTVPAIAAAGGVLLIAEPLTLRLAIASAGILGGVAVALIAADRRRRAAA